ncbi:MAG: anchored repeat-type ABC transporter ATP-binding subunit [Bifidobacteriaceae bacterium]|jgi:manganese/iron transport system ATP-binding protein|nr:anchored repeat-type ABC transporter ATP-binding subunit [Bifidobacteriaceae bacterium]
MSGQAVLRVRGLSVRLGGRPVLDNATLEVRRGQLVGLLGPNGAGKTTLLRTVLGLHSPIQGSVLVQGKRAKRGATLIGYVPQGHGFAADFPISVADAVASGLTGKLGLLRRPSAGDWESVAEALDRVGMTGLASRPIGQLSGGQRQRVMVARALALRPALLLADEPFAGLDMPAQEHLSALFSGLAAEGAAVLMTTHDIASALYGCDRIALLNRSVVAVGEPARLADDPAVWMAAFGVGPGASVLKVAEGMVR